MLSRLSKEQWLREIQWRIDVLGLSVLKGTSFRFPVASQKIVSGVYLNPLAFSRKGRDAYLEGNPTVSHRSKRFILWACTSLFNE